MQEVRVKAPATVANVVCGFDCLGFALREPFDEIIVRRTDELGIRILHRDDFDLPSDPAENVAGVAAAALMRKAGADFGIEIEITKNIMPGSGIGSSAASSAGAVVALNRLLNDRFSQLELVDLAMEGEKLASGSRHADNVAPCIFGGFTIVRAAEPLDVVSLDFPPLWATIIHPQIEIKTSDARAMLPRDVPLSHAVANWSNLAAFVAALGKGDLELLGRAMVDAIIEPARKSLIPRFDEIKFECLKTGALGGGISGSGPSIFMLSRDRMTAARVEKTMQGVYGRTSIPFNTYFSEISREGVGLLAGNE